MKNKLIELVIDAKRTDPETGSFTEYLADHLIANGVTIQRWIPVEERLPERNEIVLFYVDTNGAVYRGKYAFTGKRGAVCFSVRGERGRETVYSGITHWMPLPEPPKED